MIILDSNVISELMKPQSIQSKNVVHWFHNLREGEFFTTAFSVEEIMYGALTLPEGKGKTELLQAIEDVLFSLMNMYVLPYEKEDAENFAIIRAHLHTIGRPAPLTDMHIAAICLRHKAVLATRNVKDFEHMGIELLNPF